jgi:hypothetical protein
VNDTPEHVEQRYRALLMERSGEDRLLMGFKMFDTARAIVRASLGDAEGVDSSMAMRVALFLRTYGADFTAEEREGIAARLRDG